MPTQTKAELLAENERLQKRVAALERTKARSEAASKEIRQLRADLLQSEQQQTATAEILRIINSSPTDTQPVFDAIAESAARLCDANDVVIRRVDGDVLRVAAHFGSVPVVRPTLQISTDLLQGVPFSNAGRSTSTTLNRACVRSIPRPAACCTF